MASNVKQLLRYLSDERNKTEIYRTGAIALGGEDNNGTI